ncbi:MAG TPA: hypothetical protein VFQ16_17335 [Burkholderiaceae bacterium]|nr:hypothetical protein [Burkholderiaceae bacterium]
MTPYRCCAPLIAALALAGCATRSGDVAPLLTDPSLFAALGCESLHDETDRVRQRAAEVAYTLDERSGTNIVALGLGVTVFWPALVAMRPTGPDAQELARLKGRDEALQRALADKGCPPAPELLPAARAAGLPIAVGDLLVYEERAAAGGPARELRLTVNALRRHEIDFAAQGDAREPARPWVQDPYGNQPEALPGQGWLAWKRLLRPDMKLGDVLAGDLVPPQVPREATGAARVRGQVIALGVKHSLGRPFDAAVIELFGEVPGGGLGTRVDGVMVVDRKSGVLLRLELHSGNPEYALRRTLVRIDPPAAAR